MAWAEIADDEDHLFLLDVSMFSAFYITGQFTSTSILEGEPSRWLLTGLPRTPGEGLCIAFSSHDAAMAAFAALKAPLGAMALT